MGRYPVVSSLRVPSRPAKSAPLLSGALTSSLVLVSAGLTGAEIETLVTDAHRPEVLVETALSAVVMALGLILAGRAWRARRAWETRPYRVADRPAVRYETAAGDYIKFERYTEGVSANWTTIDGPEVLLSLPLRSRAWARAQFWTSESDSGELDLIQLEPELRRRKSDVIRAWIETEGELVVWRRGDTEAAGIAQLGVLMHSWDPNRVEELVRASATKAVRGAVVERLEGAREWVSIEPEPA
jgi:hypothetical protein